VEFGDFVKVDLFAQFAAAVEKSLYFARLQLDTVQQTLCASSGRFFQHFMSVLVLQESFNITSVVVR